MKLKSAKTSFSSLPMELSTDITLDASVGLLVQLPKNMEPYNLQKQINEILHPNMIGALLGWVVAFG
jgi:hypothetical protein